MLDLLGGGNRPKIPEIMGREKGYRFGNCSAQSFFLVHIRFIHKVTQAVKTNKMAF